MENEIKSRKDAYVRNLGVKNVLPANASVSDILTRLMHQRNLSPEDLKTKVAEAGLTEESPMEAWYEFYNKLQSGKLPVSKIPISLSRPLGEEEALSLEETLAEIARVEPADCEGYKRLLAQSKAIFDCVKSIYH